MTRQRNYGTIENPNMRDITLELTDSLRDYMKILPDLDFGDFETMRLTPDKPNSARIIIPIYHYGEEVGTITAILFRSGDGTGANTTYKLNELEIYRYLQFKDKPERVLPRKKDCIKEAFFPFFSIHDNKIYRNTVSLEELSVDNPENPTMIIHACHLGDQPIKYPCFLKALKNDSNKKRGRGSERIQLTCGHFESGKRFGDPHAIVHTLKEPKDAMQVVGFLSVNRYDNPLVEILDKVATVPEDIRTSSDFF
ncbi:MAG: hypothetical protein PHU12_01465 [Candidatus Aenigmarchaeota archaeon]|nr:hypothetical protein [Candidatus Aenigmarchaeota archaeon]